MTDVGRFLRLLTHDLQNQLGAIDLNLQVLPTLVPDGDPSFAKLAPFLARASRASNEMVEMLEDVRAFAYAISTNEGDSPGAALTACDLSMKVRDGALALTASANEREVRLQTSVAENVRALGESDSIRRSIRILIGEALRACFPGSTVEVIVAAKPVPIIEVAVSLEGVFDEGRPMLSVSLVRQLLEDSKVQILFASGSNRSSIQLLFQPA